MDDCSRVTPLSTVSLDPINGETACTYTRDGCGLCTPERISREGYYGQVSHRQRDNPLTVQGVRNAVGEQQRGIDEVLHHHSRRTTLRINGDVNWLLVDQVGSTSVTDLIGVAGDTEHQPDSALKSRFITNCD